jgi:hypothetical protein
LIKGVAQISAGEAAPTVPYRGLGGGENDLGFKQNSFHTRRMGFATEFWAHGGEVVWQLGRRSARLTGVEKR